MVTKEAKTEKEKNDWKDKNKTDLYKECLKDGHEVRVIMAGWSSIVLYCLTCETVWKVTLVKDSRVYASGVKGIVSEGISAEVEKIRGVKTNEGVKG